VEGYIRRIDRREDVVGGAECLDAASSLGETAALALRLRQEGIAFERFAARFGVDPRQQWRQPLAELAQTGLLHLDDERVTLTDAGLLVSSEIGSRFLA
jgi:coproporphyrinogen III oxidase-like Fe-S oxidoreductase